MTALSSLPENPDRPKDPAFDRKAESYETHAFVQKDAASWLAEWLPATTCHARCLELGAGTGLFSRHLKDRFTKVEISDLAGEMIDLCKQRMPDFDYSQRDAWNAQADSGTWDFVVSSSLLQWSRNPVDCLQHWKALLKPGGRILSGFFVDPTLPEMTAILDGKNPIDWRSPGQWERYAKKAGLDVQRLESQTHRYHYESALHFWKSLHGTGATVSQRMTPSQMMRLLRDYEAKYRNESGVYATWTFCRMELSL
ncbi:methyltransferase domain-containing protein [Coraliomargarita parva]|uniref:methyltransferase domain-containing protein n=1 Tax=Coraliomargarita parva TaxID=3014050 RepID=UPI0022B59164|nr:methyltransferase domain-containing protein [Coraliomargarita parva]